MPRVRRRRLAGRVLQRDSAAPREPVRAAPRPDRALGARLPASRHAGTAIRLPAGGHPVLRPVAEGRGHGHRARTSASCLDAGGRSAAAVLRDVPWAMGGGTGVAVAADRDPPLGPRRRDPQPGPVVRLLPDAPRMALAAAHRAQRRGVVPVRDRGPRPGVPGRPARGRRTVHDVRFGTAARAHRDPGRARRGVGAGGGSAVGVRGRAPVRRRAGRRIGAGVLRRPQSRPSRLPRGHPADGAGGGGGGRPPPPPPPSASSSTTPRGPSRRATGCGSRSPPRTGRWSGPRPRT